MVGLVRVFDRDADGVGLLRRERREVRVEFGELKEAGGRVEVDGLSKSTPVSLKNRLRRLVTGPTLSTQTASRSGQAIRAAASLRHGSGC